VKSVFAFETPGEGAAYETTAKRLMMRLGSYEAFLRNAFGLTEVPKAVIWTSGHLATDVFGHVPIPAYTRENLIFMCPDQEEWKQIMFEQMDGEDLPEVRSFYESVGESQLLDILAHELTHHLDLFPDDFEDERTDAIWFEEGMCFYLPRRHLLGDPYFKEVTATERTLYHALKNRYGKHPLDDFGAASYEGTLPSIMFDYWRSFLAVSELVERENGSAHAVFRKYNKWHEEGRELPLTEYFEIEV
jgi:hypothetical protein